MLRFRLPVVELVCPLSILFCVGAASAQSVPDYSPMIVFPPTPVDTYPVGVDFRVETGPTGGPYATSSFFSGVVSTEAGGAWATRNNVWGICFNLDRCTGERIVPDLYSFSETWESAFDIGAGWPNLVENNVDVHYQDGTYHRPWAMHVWTEERQAVLNFSSRPGQVSFQVNQNGKTVIGSPIQQPIHQLEVIGDAWVTNGLDVDGGASIDGGLSVEGPVEVGGAKVLTQSSQIESGPLVWGQIDGTTLRSPDDICAASQLECRRAFYPWGRQAACSAALPTGTIVFAACH